MLLLLYLLLGALGLFLNIYIIQALSLLLSPFFVGVFSFPSLFSISIFRHELWVKSEDFGLDSTRSLPFTHAQCSGRFSAQTTSPALYPPLCSRIEFLYIGGQAEKSAEASHLDDSFTNAAAETTSALLHLKTKG